MQKAIGFTFFAFFFTFISFSQTEMFEPLHADKLNVQFRLKDNIGSHVDPTRKLTFKDIQNLPFKKWKAGEYDFQSKTWYKFYLNPKIDSKKIIFSPSYADSVNVYVPYKTRYKKTTLGRLTDKDVKFSIFDNSILHIPSDSVDYTKPFYYDRVALTKTGQHNADSAGYIILANATSIWKNKKDKSIGYTKTSHLFLAVLFISMLVFLVNFAVTKDRNFLNYSLYLLFTLLIFSYHYSFLVNLLNDINPLFIDCLSHASVALASGAYFYFVISFINVKQAFPKIYPLAKYTVIGSIVFACFSVAQLLFFPYLKYRQEVLSLFDLVFLIVSISVFIYLVFQRLDFIKRIIIFGSFLLIIGQLLSLLLYSPNYFIGAVILEIIVFSSVVSFQNKTTIYNQAVSDAALANEKIERENLQEIDALKSRFITNITHEFRTPLTIILGYVETLKSKLQDKTSETEDLETISQNSENLLGLVNQMLDLAKLEQGRLKVAYAKADVVKFVNYLTQSFESLAEEKGVRLVFNSKIENPILDFDAEKLRQIMTNLISNAIKFTEDGNQVTVALTEKNTIYQIKVADTGFGIPEEDVAQIFDRFYQVQNNNFKVSQGTGIGLALTKELVQLLDGTITAASKLNEGTIFTIELPITRHALTEDADLAISKGLPQGIQVPNSKETVLNKNAPTVLVVEDNKDMSRYIVSCLHDYYQVSTAFNGQKGFDKASKETPDIIISDVMMPLMDGFEMTQKLQSQEATNHIPIILLTSKALQDDKLEGIESGADVYLTKPFQKAELLLRIQKLIEKRKALQQRYQISTVLLEKKQDKTPIADKNILFLNKVITCIHDNLADTTFNSEMLASKLALSDSQLYRKLKAITNTSTAVFIRKVRLEKAKELLETTTKTVSEIAYETGFNDPNWFGKVFKETFNATPTQIRE